MSPADTAAAAAAAAGARSAEFMKWASLGALVIQNSSTFVITRYSRVGVRKDQLYLPSVVVLLVEVIKMLICLSILAYQAGGWAAFRTQARREIWTERYSQTALLAIPALCYALQNNLIFVAISNLSAAATQVLYQMKTISTAVFSVVLLGRSFQPAQWLSFALLTAGVLLVQSQDAKSSTSPTGASPAVGCAAALGAAVMSGFAGVYLEKMFTKGSTSLWMRNVQLGLFAIPLQLLAIWQFDRRAVRKLGLLHGFHASTWVIVAVQICGALLTAFVIKFAGNILKTFATVLALLCTCLVSTFIFDFTPTRLFGVGVLVTTASIWLYAFPASVPLVGKLGKR